MKKILAILFGVAALPARAEFLAPPAFYYEEEIVEELPTETQAPTHAAPMAHAPVVSPRNTQRTPGPAAHRATSTNQVRGAGVRQTASQTGGAPTRSIGTRASAPAGTSGTIRSTAQPTNVSRSAVTQTVRPPSASNRAPAAARPVSNRSATTRGNATARASAMANSMNNVPPATQTSAPVAAVPISAPAPSPAPQARIGNNPEVNSARAVSLSGTAMATARGSVATRSSATPTLFNATPPPAPDQTQLISEAEQMAAITGFCRAQYMDCMDNFCNVLDDNQGRCSCSPHVEKYADAEKALQEATIALQQVAVDIRYLGLTKEEVKSLFAETEAEEAMRNKNDQSILRQSLNMIETWLIDPTQIETSSSGNPASIFDFNSLSDFSGGFDFNFLSNQNTSVLNQRGEALFQTAKTRCDAIIKDCKKQSVDTTSIILFYDLEIDKQCVAYERQLTDANATMRQTVRNATNVLQQARLMVAQNKNQFDLRSCVAELDKCMKDEFVCGPNYKHCLDKTGNFFANGELIKGSQPLASNSTSTLSSDMLKNWQYGSPTLNAFSGAGSISDMISNMFGKNSNENTNFVNAIKNGTILANNENLAFMLVNRVGYIDDNGRAQGMCSSVLTQCQTHTYKSNSYDFKNEVLREFLSRTLMQIKARQDEVIANYAQQCRQEVLSCLTRNSFTENNADTPARSCLGDITTCLNVLGTAETAGMTGVCPNNKTLLKESSKWVCK